MNTRIFRAFLATLVVLVCGTAYAGGPQTSTGRPAAWIQSGNAWGTTGVLGTTDAQALNLIRGGQTFLTTDSASGTYTGQIFLAAGTNGLDVRTTNSGTGGKVYIQSQYLQFGPFGGGPTDVLSIRWFDLSFNTVDITIPGAVTSYSLTLPAVGPVNGQVLQANGSGVFSWANPSALVTQLDVTLTAGTATTASGKDLSLAKIVGSVLKTPSVAVGVVTATISANNVIVTSYAAGAVTAVTDASTYTISLLGAR